MYSLKTIVFGLCAFSLAVVGTPVKRDDALTCGNGQVVSCCGGGSIPESNDIQARGLVDDILNNLSLDDLLGEDLLGVGDLLQGVLGGSCSPLSITGVGGNVPVNKMCGDTTAVCCTGDSAGGLLPDIACNSIHILKK